MIFIDDDKMRNFTRSARDSAKTNRTVSRLFSISTHVAMF